METPLSAASEIALATIRDRAPAAFELAKKFDSANFTLALVGGSVRDALLGRLGNDLDFTTNARPDEIKKILKTFAEDIWEVGIKFGTIAARKGDTAIEITTYRSEKYQSDSRNPEVEFGDNIEGDLSRRDFTINAMAIELTGKEPQFIDPHGGVTDLLKKEIRTPGSPEDSFNDDPLRMLRAARFAAQLGFTINKSVLEAMATLADRLSIISAERIRDEFIKIMLSSNPRVGITTLVDTGLCEKFLPEIPKLRLEIDEHHHHKDVHQFLIEVLGSPVRIFRKAQCQLKS